MLPHWIAQTKGHVRFLVLRSFETEFAELRRVLVFFVVVVVVDEEPYGERARCRAGGDDLPGRRH